MEADQWFCANHAVFDMLSVTRIPLMVGTPEVIRITIHHLSDHLTSDAVVVKGLASRASKGLASRASKGYVLGIRSQADLAAVLMHHSIQSVRAE